MLILYRRLTGCGLVCTSRKVHCSPLTMSKIEIFYRYSREANRASEFAPRILNDHGLRVVMKVRRNNVGSGVGLTVQQSDQPVTNSRYLLYEAQLAHYYGLDEYKALSSVTAYPAEVMGLGWRIGYIKEG